MFSFADGKVRFYQWDTKQRLIVEDASIEQVHFCNRTDDCSLKREVYNEGGKRLVNVPDILLQDAWRLHVYAWDGKETKHEDIFGVEPRTKPQNYVYTEEEISNYDALEKRIDQIEENGISDETIAAAIEGYLDENPIEAGATEEEAAQIEANKAAIAALEQNAANHATKEYVDNAVSNVDVDLKGYATEDYVDSAIANAQLELGDDAIKDAVEEYLQTNDIAADNILFVELTETSNNKYTANKTLAEVSEAANGGKAVIATLDDSIWGKQYFYLTRIDDDGATFSYHWENNYTTIELAADGVEGNSGYMITPEDMEHQVYQFNVSEDTTGYFEYDISYNALMSQYYTYGNGIVCIFNSAKNDLHLMLQLVEHTDDNGFKFVSFDGSKYCVLTFNKLHQVVFTENELSVGGESVDLSNYYTKTEADGKYALKTEIPDVSGFQTAAQVQTAIENYVGVIENGSY